MIRYTLRCPDQHQFDSWFQSSAAYDGLRTSGRLSCTVCGSTEVEKAPMAPAVRPAREDVASPPAPPALKTPATEVEATLLALRRHVEENSEYVGVNFVTEARAIHDGEAPERAIYGEARPEEARRLIEDGVPVAPLPFVPLRKTN